MFFSHFITAFILAIGLSISYGGANPLNANILDSGNAIQASSSDSLQAVHRAIASAAFSKRDRVFKNSTSLDRSWNGAVLFTYKKEADSTLGTANVNASADVEIVCTTCYVKGTATAQFTIQSNFNASQAFKNFTSEVKNDIENISTTFVQAMENSTEQIGTDILHGNFSSIEDFDFPTIPFDLDINTPPIPECQLRFQFDGLELYMQIDTILSLDASYTLNLYKSKTPLGYSAGEELEIGLIFTIDLILTANAKIDISSGFHIKLEDGVALNIPMFSQNISSIIFNGGHFEFLPVTIESAGMVLTAVLRVGAHAALEIGTPSFGIVSEEIRASAGVEVGVWVDVAEFTTNVTNSGSNGCELHVVEVYSLLVGANAGATVAVDEHNWGLTPNTSTAIFTITLADACAVTKTSSAVAGGVTSSRAVKARATNSGELTTTTISTTMTYTGIACLSKGMVNCPASLQTTSKYSAERTLITSVPSGSKATFPAAYQSTVASTVAFGKNAKALNSVSGTPSTYTAGPSKPVINGKTGGVSNKIIIGVSVGVGVPVLIAILAGVVFFFKRAK